MGGALLLLPVTNAPAGFAYTTLTMISIWLLTLFTGLLLLEVSLWLPPNTHLVSMAECSLGIPGKVVTWIAYVLLLYALLSAYISGGADILATLALKLSIIVPEAIHACLFTALFGFIVYRGIKTIDRVNRALMLVKLGAYCMLVLFIIPQVDLHRLEGGHAQAIIGATMYMVVSFGFAIIIPSLRNYFNDEIIPLRLVIIIGTGIPLLCYVAWTFVILGVIPQQELIHLLQKQYTPSDLVTSLGYSLDTGMITHTAEFFTSVCILTAFLGVSLSLVDFLSDGLKIKKHSRQGLWIYGITFIPALFMAILEPNSFRVALRFAGIICVILLILLPLAMVWRGRYRLQIKGKYQVFGGKFTLTIATIAGLGLFLIALKETFMPSF